MSTDLEHLLRFRSRYARARPQPRFRSLVGESERNERYAQRRNDVLLGAQRRTLCVDPRRRHRRCCLRLSGDRIAGTDLDTNDFSDVDQHPHTNTVAYSHVLANDDTNANSNVNPDPDVDAGPHSDIDADPYTDINSDLDADADSHQYVYAVEYAVADVDTDSDRYTHLDSDFDVDADVDEHVHAVILADANRNDHTNVDSKLDFDLDEHADAHVAASDGNRNQHAAAGFRFVERPGRVLQQPAAGKQRSSQPRFGVADDIDERLDRKLRLP